MRDRYKWYLSGEKTILQGWTAGVGIVIRNDLKKHILDIEPINDRIMTVSIKANREKSH